MARQERTARRTKQAEATAEEILRQHQDRLYAHRSTQKRLPEGHPRKATATPAKAPRATRTAPAGSSATVDSEADVAAEVRRLRDEEGLSWVQVGAKLGLPGAKSGAASARKLYASTGADYRTTAVKKTTRTSPPRREPKAKAPTRTETKMRVRGGEHLIPLDTPDAEIVAMLRNRHIRWSINVADLCDGKGGGEPVFSEQEATVHPDGLRVERGDDGSYEPYVHFREMHATREGPVAASFRTVRLSSIHDVR
jgi:hypothetical protein